MSYPAPLACERFAGLGKEWEKKRGGSRVIYFNRLTSGEVVLLIVYSKAKFDNLRPEFLLQLRERFDEKK